MIRKIEDKTFYILWLASILGALSVLPYVSAVHSEVDLSPGLVVAVSAQSSLLYGLIVFFGLRASRKAGFHIYPIRNYALLSVTGGLFAGFSLKLLDQFLFAPKASLLIQIQPEIAMWKGLLASIYGAVNEEILTRLFLVSAIVLLLKKITPATCNWRALMSILFSSFVFGLGHLPMLYNLVDTPNFWDVLRVLSLNGLAGTVFGCLYWKRGLASAMLAHFVADLVIHVF